MVLWQKWNGISGALKRTLLALLPAAATLLALSCGKPFDVKPRTSLPAANFTAEIRTGDLLVRAAAITDEDLLYKTFDCNPLLAGFYPVRVRLENTGTSAVSLHKPEFHLSGPGGKAYKLVAPREVFKLLIHYYGITSYNKHGYRESRHDFLEYDLDETGDIQPGGSRQGLLFFEIPSGMGHSPGFTLAIGHLQPDKKTGEVLLKLN